MQKKINARFHAMEQEVQHTKCINVNDITC